LVGWLIARWLGRLSAGALRRGADLEHITSQIQAVLSERTDLPKDAQPSVDVVGLSNNGVVLSVHGASAPDTSPHLQNEVPTAVHRALHEAGIATVAMT
jgi:hypothetical protein